jgi:hypothetical protein
MNVKLANWIIGTMKQDFEIFDFIIEKNFEMNICTLGIPEIKDLEMLDEIMNVTRRFHPEVFEFAFEVYWAKNNLFQHREIERKEKERMEKEQIEIELRNYNQFRIKKS